MKPLRKGAARTELTKHLHDLMQFESVGTASTAPSQLTHSQIAAVVGGAIEQTLVDMGHDKEEIAVFWRYTSHNLWNLIRSLRASNQLEKV